MRFDSRIRSSICVDCRYLKHIELKDTESYQPSWSGQIILDTRIYVRCLLHCWVYCHNFSWSELSANEQNWRDSTGKSTPCSLRFDFRHLRLFRKSQTKFNKRILYSRERREHRNEGPHRRLGNGSRSSREKDSSESKSRNYSRMQASIWVSANSPKRCPYSQWMFKLWQNNKVQAFLGEQIRKSSDWLIKTTHSRNNVGYVEDISNVRA